MDYKNRHINEEGTERLLIEDAPGDNATGHRCHRIRPTMWMWTALIFLLISTNLLTFSLTTLSPSTHAWSKMCLGGTGDAIITPLQPPRTISFKSTINHSSIYRSEPSLQVDEAWNSLGTTLQYAILSPADARRAQVSPDHVYLPDNSFRTKDGTNVTQGGYIAHVEVMHQLHCLNMVRKSLWFNYDYYKKLGQGPFKDGEATLVLHVGHCLDMLREKLMCDADTGFVPYYWLKTMGLTAPDFARPHVCGDFKGVQEWAKSEQRWLRDGIKMPGPAEGAFRVEGFQ